MNRRTKIIITTGTLSLLMAVGVLAHPQQSPDLYMHAHDYLNPLPAGEAWVDVMLCHRDRGYEATPTAQGQYRLHVTSKENVTQIQTDQARWELREIAETTFPGIQWTTQNGPDVTTIDVALIGATKIYGKEGTEKIQVEGAQCNNQINLRYEDNYYNHPQFKHVFIHELGHRWGLTHENYTIMGGSVGYFTADQPTETYWNQSQKEYLIEYGAIHE